MSTELHTTVDQEKIGIPQPLFIQMAEAVVPRLRALLAELDAEGLITPSVGMTAEVKVDGTFSRVRITVELDPEDNDQQDD